LCKTESEWIFNYGTHHIQTVVRHFGQGKFNKNRNIGSQKSGNKDSQSVEGKQTKNRQISDLLKFALKSLINSVLYPIEDL